MSNLFCFDVKEEGGISFVYIECLISVVWRDLSLDQPEGIILKFSLAPLILLYVKVEHSQYKLLLIGKILYFRENAYSSFFILVV